MRTISGTLAASSTAALIIALAAACADSGEAVSESRPDGSVNAIPESDAGEAPPAEVDASDAAMVDAAAHACSKDDFCRTDVASNQTLQAVWADGAGVAWAGTKEGKILRWDGTQWTERASGLGEIRALWGSGPNEIWAAGTRGIYAGHGVSSDDITFTPSTLPGDETVSIASIWGTSSSDVWAVGQRADGVSPAGRVYHYAGPAADPTASPWTLDPLSDVEETTYDRVWGSSGSGVWIAAAQLPINPWDDPTQQIYRRAPADTSFAPIELPGYEAEYLPDGVPSKIFGATSSSDDEVWLVVQTDWFQQGYYHGVSADNGATFAWSIIPFSRIDALAYTAVAGSPSSVWAVGQYGRVESWDGTTFTQAAIASSGVPIIDPFYAIWTAMDEVWAVGKGIALHRAKK